jgi:hypothetical protein
MSHKIARGKNQQEKERFQGKYRIPTVSVLMPVYNGEHYLREAMDSIFEQTLTDYEFLIIDDGSNDESANIIRSYRDSRIVFMQNDQNRGLVYSLNRGLQYARGEYIARMDQDDISLSTRLTSQVEYMDTHPQIGLCGTWMEVMGDRSGQIMKYHHDCDDIKCLLLFVSVVAHPTVIMRRNVLADSLLQYSDTFQHAEDYELWLRLSRKTNITNLNEVLLKYRISPGQITQKHRSEQLQCHMRVQVEAIKILGFEPSPKEQQVHAALSFNSDIPHPEYIKDAAQWLLKLQARNDSSKCYPEPAFTKILRHYWGAACRRGESHLGEGIKKYWQENDFLLANHSVQQQTL